MGADIYQISFSLCRSLFNLIFKYNAAAHFSVNKNTELNHFTVAFTKLTKPKWKISQSKIETKLFKVPLYIGSTKTLLKSYNSEKFIQKNSSK
jgi:type IV secretory pathway VirD2 relaxase